MKEITTGIATHAQIAAFLTSLRLRPGGETVEEIVGCARVMREKVVPVLLNKSTAALAIDTCGTGGDGKGTFNISTGASILAAAAGAIVAKHGNRSATSKCGSADVLEALDMRIDLDPDHIAQCVQNVGFGFIFTQAHHPTMKYIGSVRRGMGIRTIFNILGPLTNPAHTPYQVVGVSDPSLVRKIGEVLLRLGSKHALIIYGEDGIDEFSLAAPTRVCEIRRGTELLEYAVTPEMVGLARINALHPLLGGDPAYNAALLRQLLKEDTQVPASDILCFNAGAVLFTCELVSSLAEGVKLARAMLRQGKAERKLDEIIAWTQACTLSESPS